MGDFCKMKKVCGFYISNMHLLVMMLPYINKEINKNKKIITLFENNLEKEKSQIISKLLINKEQKNNILKINWKKSNVFKYSNMEQILDNNLKNKNNIDIFICGSEKYINIANENINKYLNKNIKKIENKKIKIISAYEINDFNENMQEILNNNDIMFNTSGEHDIKEFYGNSLKKTI